MGRRDRRKNAFKTVAIGSAVAAAAGYVAGVLTAPKSGKQTRQDIRNRAEKGRGDVEKELKKLLSELDKIIRDAKDKRSKAGTRASKELNDITAKAKDAKEKVREVLSAIHEGDAEDKDLRRALRDAQGAIGHFKDYLKK